MNTSKNTSALIQRLDNLQERYGELKQVIAEPELPKKPKEYKKLMQEYVHLDTTISAYIEFKNIESELADTKQMLQSETDAELKALASEEISKLTSSSESLIKKLKILLIPPDPMDGKNIMIEIRAGTGGDEASLFVSDLYRMYGRYAENLKWKTELITASETEAGGFKEVVFSVSGKQVYGSMRYESGVHRVQRVPTTESQGRIHTSAVTVAVLPEAEETDIQINENDLKIDVYRSSGPGGQSVNTTDSAVRITHLPTGIVVICQDEKSQLKNKAKAMRVLRSRLYEAEEIKKNTERAAARRSQIGSGDRSERIRTYNFPQGRVTDHRINLTLYKLEQAMQGDIGELLDALKVSATENIFQNTKDEQL